jgi:hypothetical protein
MRFVVPAILLIVAAIHALRLIGVAGAVQLERLYGIDVQEPNLQILLRHRAVLFGMLAAFQALAAMRPAWHGLGLLAGIVSMGSFLLIAHMVGGYNHGRAR